MAQTRPPGWECPWCGENGVAIDRTLPPELQLCDECQRSCDEPEQPPAPKPIDPHVESLRRILVQHIRDFNKPWPNMEFAKSMFGNMVLGALEELGLDRKEEMQRAIRAAEAQKPLVIDHTLPYAEKVRLQAEDRARRGLK